MALINTADSAGGAESVARMVRDGLRLRGHLTDLWVGRRRRRADDPGHTHQIPSTPAQHQAAKRYAQHGFFSLGVSSSDVFCNSAALADVDLIHLHNLHGHYFSITALPRLAARAPLVWTFHDFFPITGGCVFPRDCDRWLSTCGNCPRLGEYPIATEFDHTRWMQTIKRKVFRDLPVTIVTPSEHLGLAVKRSGVFQAVDQHVIPYGVDTDVFHPHREQARRALGLSFSRPVIGLVAQGVDDPRKGLDYAIAALRQIDVPGLIVLLAGGGESGPITEALAAHDVHCLGYVTDRAQLSHCYAAADLFLSTSLAENYPCVVQESMASGTAVLGFGIDGVNEQIVHNKTGFLVPTGDTGALTKAARRLLDNRPLLVDIGEAARRHAEAEWRIDLFAKRHELLYQDVLARVGKIQASSVTMSTRSPNT